MWIVVNSSLNSPALFYLFFTRASVIKGDSVIYNGGFTDKW